MTTQTETAILAGGCFWGMQDLIRRFPGVVSTRVGYSGGDVANATYEKHGTHAESIEIVFDPQRINYRQILEYFFQLHDPTTRNRQGNVPRGDTRTARLWTVGTVVGGWGTRCTNATGCTCYASITPWEEACCYAVSLITYASRNGRRSGSIC